MLHQGSQVSFTVVRGSEALLSSHCSGIGPHPALTGESRVFYRVALHSFGVSQVATGTSGNLSCCLRGVRFSFNCVGIMGFLLSRCKGIGHHLRLRLVSQGSSAVAAGISGFLFVSTGGITACLVLRHGTLFSSRGVKRESGFLSSSGR